MNSITSGRSLRRIVFVYLAFGFIGSYAFASCSSTLSGTTANVTCTAATDQIVVSQLIGFWVHTGTSTFGLNEFDWGSDQSLAAGGTVHFVSLGGGQLAV